MKADFNINHLTQDQVTIQVKLRGVASFRVRMFVVAQLIRLALWLAPFRVEVISEP